MAASPYQDEFRRYVQAHPQQQAVSVFPARGKVGASMPAVYGATPYGTIAIFPEYLVFLTLNKDDSAVSVLVNDLTRQFVHSVIAQGLGLMSLLTDAISARLQQGKQGKLMIEALENPRSMFIPLRTLRTVETGRHYSSMQYMRLTTTEQVYVFLREMESRNPLKAMGEVFSEWHPEAVAYLRQAAARSGVR